MTPKPLRWRMAANPLAIGGRIYLLALPTSIPAGHLLVHNQVQPTRDVGMRGFRIWLTTQVDTPPLALCDCSWAPELGPHFRVASVPERREGRTP